MDSILTLIFYDKTELKRMKITVQDYKDKNKIEKNPSHDSSVDKNIHTQIQFKNLDSTLIQFFQKKSFFMIIQIKKIIQQNTMKK